MISVSRSSEMFMAWSASSSSVASKPAPYPVSLVRRSTAGRVSKDCGRATKQKQHRQHGRQHGRTDAHPRPHRVPPVPVHPARSDATTVCRSRRRRSTMCLLERTVTSRTLMLQPMPYRRGMAGGSPREQAHAGTTSNRPAHFRTFPAGVKYPRLPADVAIARWSWPTSWVVRGGGGRHGPAGRPARPEDRAAGSGLPSPRGRSQPTRSSAWRS